MVKNVQTRFSLPRKRIIKSSNEIRELLEKGVKFTGKTVNIFCLPADVRMFAVIMPKRIGSAVKRNRMKRLCREAYRKNPQWFAGKRVIIFGKKFIKSYHLLEDEIAQVMDLK